MNDVRIALAQICPEPGSPDSNAEKVIEFMKRATKEKADLIVFPECSLTGYSPEIAE
jgi:NAD+ synthase (glutamine-hydrolysing)